MGKIYQNPPLIEALCEFRFQDGNEWDLTLPGLFYNEIKNRFPMKREQSNMQVEMDTTDLRHSTNVRGNIIPTVQFYNTDETCLIQLSPGILSINHLQPYSNWQHFKKLIFGTLSTYMAVAKPANFARIGLRYINRVDISSKDSIYDYFSFKPCLPTLITQEITSLLQRVELPFHAQNGQLVLILASVPDDDSYILDLDFVTLDISSLSFENTQNWVESAHNQIENVFEASITDVLRAKMREATL